MPEPAHAVRVPYPAGRLDLVNRLAFLATVDDLGRNTEMLAARRRRGGPLPRDGRTTPAHHDRIGRTMTRTQPGWRGRFFEDFVIGDGYEHPLGRTVNEADNTWFALLTRTPLTLGAERAR